MDTSRLSSVCPVRLVRMLPPVAARGGREKNDKAQIMALTTAELCGPRAPPPPSPPSMESAARLRFLVLVLNSDREADAQKVMHKCAAAAKKALYGDPGEAQGLKLSKQQQQQP